MVIAVKSHLIYHITIIVNQLVGTADRTCDNNGVRTVFRSEDTRVVTSVAGVRRRPDGHFVPGMVTDTVFRVFELLKV